MEFLPGAFEHEWERRRAALLHERSLGRPSLVDEEEWRRRGGVVAQASPLPGAAAGQFGLGAKGGAFGRTRRRAQGSYLEPSMRSRFAALASGSQPAVVKLASFGGGGRLGAMINYVSRNGAVIVETERGEDLRGRDELAGIHRDWDHLMGNRAESRDIGTFLVEVMETEIPNTIADLHTRARTLLQRGLGDRSFVFAVTSAGDGRGYRVEGVSVLRDSAGERLTGDAKASAIVQERLGDEGRKRQQAVTFRFTGYGNGIDYGSARVRDLVERHPGIVRTAQGEAIIDAKQAAELVQRDWRKQLHSRKSRDVMHVVMSARAGTDVEAFHAAARDFLAREFAGYRYVLALHDPSRDPKAEETGGKRPHVHVHAIIAMRSDAGDRIETSIASFRRWRVAMAEKAREHGIRMEMTDRRDRASAPAYSRNQVRPTNRKGRTQHEGTSEAGQRRYEAKRADHQNIASTPDSKIYSMSARGEWLALAKNSGEADVKSFATAQAIRLEADYDRAFRQEMGSSDPRSNPSQYRINLVKLAKTVGEGDIMRHMTRQEFESYEKRVETALFQAERETPQNERESFEKIAAAARNHVNLRRELMELQEQGGPTDPGLGRSARKQSDEADVYWQEVVARHGLRAAEAANRAVLEVERCRDEIEKAMSGEIKADRAALQADLQREISKAAELGAEGNTLIREIAEVDEELRVAIERAEQSRDDRKTPKPADAPIVEVGTNNSENLGPEEEFGRRSSELERDHGAVHPDRTPREQTRPSDGIGIELARQHVRRPEQLQGEIDDRREQEGDEREQ